MKISDTEWLVMRVVWQHGSVGAAEVIEAVLPETGWSHRTAWIKDTGIRFNACLT